MEQLLTPSSLTWLRALEVSEIWILRFDYIHSGEPNCPQSVDLACQWLDLQSAKDTQNQNLKTWSGEQKMLINLCR